MSVSFVAAVTSAVRQGDGDSWDLTWYGNDGVWPKCRQETYRQCRQSALGPEWVEGFRATMRVERGVVADVMHRECLAQVQDAPWPWGTQS
jgi:hypothetical protein